MSSANSENFTLTRTNTLEMTAGLGVLLSGVPYIFFYFVQENVYGRENVLKGVSELLNNQTFLTSYFALLGALSMIVAMEHKYQNKILMKYPLVLPFLLTVLNTSYEVYQAYHPKYVDSNALDIVMGWLAFLTICTTFSVLANFEKPAAVANHAAAVMPKSAMDTLEAVATLDKENANRAIS